MRSRTEMVTTNFVDSEEDYSDDDDSEEDWRPSASTKNGRKQPKYGTVASTRRGGKRKASSTAGSKKLKKKIPNDNHNSEDDEVNDPSEDDYDDFEIISGSSKDKPSGLLLKDKILKNNSLVSSNDNIEQTVYLLVYVKDLIGADIHKNKRLCLWRKDDNDLLQKYIRVKTSPEQFLFTSSSVYSSFDDKRTSDFYQIKVKLIDSNRRVQIINPSELHQMVNDFNNHCKNNDDILSGEISDIAENQQISVKSKANIKKPLLKRDDKKYNEEGELEDEEDDCYLEGDDEDIEGCDKADD